MLQQLNSFDGVFILTILCIDPVTEHEMNNEYNKYYISVKMYVS